MRAPLVDLRASYLPIREALLAEFDEIPMEMQPFLGPNVAEPVVGFFAATGEGGQRR